MNIHQFPKAILIVMLLSVASVTTSNGQDSSGPAREVLPGFSTERVIPGEPYEPAGMRIIFANWYYIQPGDLDWVNATGKSVYVNGNESPGTAIFKGIRAPQGIHLRAHHPEVVGPLKDMPHRMIMQDGDLYRGWSDDSYYESTNGMTWKKVARLKLDKAFSDGLWHVFIDPTAPAGERYKTIWNDLIDRPAFEEFRKHRPDGWEPRALVHLADGGKVSCIRGGYSADGIVWNAYPDPIVVEYADTYNTAYYDPAIRRYVLYTRQWSIGPRTKKLPPDIRKSWTGSGRRAIGRSESTTFTNFPPSELMIEPTPDMLPSEVLYTNCRTTVPGAPDVHVMFPTIWNGSINDTTRIAMLSSHDGQVWHWVPEGNILATQEPGKWNGGCVWATPNLIELPDQSWALPYSAHNVPHKYPRGQRVGGVGYAIWPKGRMISLDADETGEFHLMRMIPPGRKLKINAETQETGGIWIEVVGIDGRKLDQCDPITGDKVWSPVTWKREADLGFKIGSPITLHLKMKQARLYGLEFE